jgi:hypothetical protein
MFGYLNAALNIRATCREAMGVARKDSGKASI